MKKLKLCILIVISSMFLTSCYGTYPIESLAIIIGIGNDLGKEGKVYSATLENLVFKKKDEITSTSITGEDYSIYATQNYRQTKNNKKWLLAAEVAYLISEERARFGIKDLMDAFVRDIIRNENAYIAITKQRTEEVFNIKPKYADNVSEELQGILEFSSEANFFEPRVRLINLLLMYYQEGRKIILPYVEIKEDMPEVTGLALFKGYKMVRKVDLQEARLINLMRAQNGNGYLTILSSDPQEYLELECRNKTNVKVSKKEEKLNYDIFVNLEGNLRLNSLEHEKNFIDEIEHIQERLAEKVQKNLEDEIKKMQDEYKTDWLELGKYAVAKYGRDKNYGSDEYFCNANINVHVKVKINTMGRKEDH